MGRYRVPTIVTVDILILNAASTPLYTLHYSCQAVGVHVFSFFFFKSRLLVPPHGRRVWSCGALSPCHPDSCQYGVLRAKIPVIVLVGE